MGNGPINWSLSVIVKNGAEHIAQTLESAKVFCDELVVVDTGSTDDTVAIAKAHGARVFHFEWIDDFSAARNEAIKHCRGKWIIWLDCGDIIPPKASSGFLSLKDHLAKTVEKVDFVWCNINRGITDDGAVVFKFNTPRVFRKATGTQWIGAVHEYLDFSNQNAMLWQDAWVDDPLALNNAPTERNIKILRRLLDEGDTTTRTAYYYANELRDHKRWAEAVEAYDHFLNMNYFSWEHYDSLISLGNCHRQLGSEEASCDAYFRALRFDASRAEAFMALGDLAYEKQNWRSAMAFYKACVGMVRPIEGFVLETCYTWLPHDRLAVCYGNLGMLDDAIAATNEALRLQCPERSRLFMNLTMFLDAKNGIVPQQPQPPVAQPS